MVVGETGRECQTEPYGGAMAIFHRATLTPTKEHLIADWVPTQSWGPAVDVPINVIGSYRFDDPDGRVGMEAFLITAGDTLLHVPLTYRDEPLVGADDALITEMQHSVLGTRCVYDGVRDPLFVVMLAGVTMTGQGEALGMAMYEGRWYIAPSNVRINAGFLADRERANAALGRVALVREEITRDLGVIRAAVEKLIA